MVHDTVYVEQIEEIQKEFNAAQFEQGKADLNDDAKLALHDLAKVLNRNPKLKLSIEGHTSSEGTEAVNQKLSEDRAQARKVMLEAIVDVVNRHCKLAAGAGLMPVPAARSRYGVGYGHLATARQPNHFTCSHLWSVIYTQ